MFLISLCFDVGVKVDTVKGFFETFTLNDESVRSCNVRIRHIFENNRPCLKGCLKLKEAGVCPFSGDDASTADFQCMEKLHNNPEAPLRKFIGYDFVPAHPAARLRAAAVAKAADAMLSKVGIPLDPKVFWKHGLGQ